LVSAAVSDLTNVPSNSVHRHHTSSKIRKFHTFIPEGDRLSFFIEEERRSNSIANTVIAITMLRATLLSLLMAVSVTAQECLSDATIEFAITETLEGPEDGSCCMNHICGLPCSEPVSEPGTGYGIAVAISIAVSFIIGMGTFFIVKGESENFFVAGRSLPLWIVSITLAAQSIDSNALLGNVDLSYKYHFYDGGELLVCCCLLLLV
jgi:hypothetical protein